MFNIYQIYLIKKFTKKLIFILMVFLSLTIILGLLEEISFFKNIEVNFLYPYYLTILNTPVTLLEIFPFMLLLSTQFTINELFVNEELGLLKNNGLKNIQIIKIFFLLTFFIGILTTLILYNISSELKFKYSVIKNNFSNDNKYLAMVNESGLWIKDEIKNKKFIIKSKYIQNNYLFDTVINEFDQNFLLLRTIQSKKIDISDNNWIIYNPNVYTNNNKNKKIENLILSTNFNEKKIKNFFSNFSTLNLIELINLKKDFDKLGYSSSEIKIHLLRLLSLPIFYALLTTLGSILMFNLLKNRSLLTNVTIGILVSVIVYYTNFIFNSLGANESLPIFLSIYFPLIIISIITLFGLININDK